MHPIPNIEFPNDFIYSIDPAHNDKPCWASLVSPPAKPPKTRNFIPSFVFLSDLLPCPIFRTSAVAIPSGNRSFNCSISDRLNGMVNNTPINPEKWLIKKWFMII